MLGLLLIAAAAGFGVGAVRRLGWGLARLEAAALVAAAALTGATWVVFLTSWLAGGAAGLPLAIAALALAGLGLGRGRRIALVDDPGASLVSWAALALVLGVLFHGHMLHGERAGLFTGGSSYGDLALHASLANHFAVTDFDGSSPLVEGQALTYPFLGDFLAGALVRGGWSLSATFALIGWLSTLVGLALIHALAVRLFARRAAGTIAVWLIVLSGSTFGIVHALADLRAHGLPAELGELPNYSHQRPRGLVFANFVCDFFLPQRAMTSALPCFWAAVVAIERAWSSRARAALALAGVAIGLLPLLHTHSFLFGVGLLGWCASWRSVAERRMAWRWWGALALALAVAGPQLAWQFGHSWQRGFGRWHTGWLAPPGHALGFWLRNLGAAIVVAPLGLIAARRRRGSLALPMLVAALLVFVVANLYQFQPHDWDNMKFFVYAYMIVAIALAGGLAAAWSAGGLRRGLAGAALLALTATGAVSVVREGARHDQLASAGDLRLAARLRAVLPPDARVLTADQHNHVVPMLTGRAIVMGYRGWLWTHGIDYRDLERDVALMFAGRPETPALLARHHVTHVYLGPGELGGFHANRAWFADHYPRVLADGGVEVYDVRPRPPALARR